MQTDFGFANYDPARAKQTYDEFYQKQDFRALPTAELYSVRAMLRRYGVRPGARIMDLGCGTGKYAHALASCGMSVTGVDISEQGVAVAAGRYPDAQFVVGDATRLQFEPESFDVLFSSGLSIFNEPDPDALTRFSEYLLSFVRPGGLFLFIKTSSLTDRPSKGNTRFDYSVGSFARIFSRIAGSELLGCHAVVPHAFPLAGAALLHDLPSALTTGAARLLRQPVRVYAAVRRTPLQGGARA
jgi:ubiquinone/menaquinone biosynthesis C-methylase UbiE